jgi:hypothetical protein
MMSMKQTLLGKLFDFLLVIMATVYFVGFLSFHPDSLFLKEAPYNIPDEYEVYFEALLWIFFTLLALDLYLKYRKLNNWNLFLKKHWHEIAMFALIPFLTILKAVKISIKLVKILKASKSGFKVFYKAKKASKHLDG